MFRESKDNYPDVYLSDALCVKKSDLHRFGVFAAKDIKARTLIERCATIMLPTKSLLEMEENMGGWSPIGDYVFTWPVGANMVIALGFGSIYNHSTYEDNVAFMPDHKREAIEFTTKRDIKAGEELTIRYIPRSSGGDDALWSLPFIPDDLPDDVDLS